MFTGIVEELGTVVSIDGGRIRIGATTVLEDIELGASIAVNGCCLTAVEWSHGDSATRHDGDPATRHDGDPATRHDGDPATRHHGWWECEATEETFSRTNLATIAPGDRVNLERPVRLSDRLGGHLVQGHVDGVGEIVAPIPDLRVRCDPSLLRYVVEKGSITVDGVSLTVVDVLADGFTVAVIPHTGAITTLGVKGPGAQVNLEVDVTAKYVERLLAWKLA